MTRVQVHPADDGGCGRYRLTWPARALAGQGHDVRIAGRLTVHGRTYPDGRQIPDHVDVDVDADVVVFQRPMARQTCELIPVLQRQGVAVVVEIDDDFHALPPGHPARKQTAALVNPERNRLWLARACKQADLVTCSTPALVQRYAPHGRAVVLENCVPESYLTVPRPVHDGPPKVGWTGSTVTHVGDLDVIGDAATGTRFHVIGTGVGVPEALRLESVTSTGWVPIDRYPYEYARLDVALCPLVLNPFNQAKSWLKPLEALSLGVRVVASPTDEYRRLSELSGLIHLAGTPQEWAVRIAAAADIEDFDFTAAAREFCDDWTYERRAWRWAEAWDQATHNRKARAA